MAIQINQFRATTSQTVVELFSDAPVIKPGLSALFPTKTTVAKQVSIEVQRNRQLVAVDVQRGAGPNRNRFNKSTQKIYVPPFFSESFDYTSLERYDIVFAQLNANGTPSELDVAMLIDGAYSEAKKLQDKITRAIELMRASVVQFGTVDMVNGDTINFQRQAGSMVQLAGEATWDQLSTATPLEDLTAGATFLRQQGLSQAHVINAFMGQDAFSNLMQNDEIKNQAVGIYNQIRRIDIGFPEFDEVSGFTFQGKIAVKDATIYLWTYTEFYETLGGDKVYYLDQDTVFMVPADFNAKTIYAGIPAIMGQPGTGQYVAPMEGEFYIHDVVDPIRKSWDWIVESAPVPVLVSVDRIYTIKTT